jgi:hypothetical protein
MSHAPELENQLFELENAADIALQRGDAARVIELLMDLSACCLSAGVDCNDRLLRWAVNVSDRMGDAEPRVLREIASAALMLELAPLAPVAYLAAGVLELRRNCTGAALHEFCFAACLYRALGAHFSNELDAAIALLMAVPVDRRGEEIRMAALRYDALRWALRKWWQLPPTVEEALAHLLADQIAFVGGRAAVELADALTELLIDLAATSASPAAVQFELARGLRNAVVSHGRFGRFSKAEGYFAALLRVTGDFVQDANFQRQLAAGIVSMILYSATVGKKDRAAELVEMLERLSARFAGSPEFLQLLDQGKKSAECLAQETGSDSKRAFPLSQLLVMNKALARLNEPRKLADCILRILDYTPEVRDMERDTGYRNWAVGLGAFRDFMSISPLFQVLADISAGGLPFDAPAILRYRLNHFHAVPWQVFWNAAQIARAHTDEQPHASFVLAAITALGWFEVVGEALFDNVSVLHPGWLEIPHVLATLAAKLGNLVDSRALAEQAYDMVSAAKTVGGETGNDEGAIQKAGALERYRQLSGQIYEQYVTAVSNLADDLHECCRPGEENLRAELGAVLFTLGYPPESQLFVKGAQYRPSRALIRRTVVQSLACMPFDALLTSVWLEIVNSPLVQWSDHRSLELFIRRKSEFRLSSPFPFVEPDSQETPVPALLDSVDNPYSLATLYAYALIAWFQDPCSERFRKAAEAVSGSIEHLKALSFGDNPFLLVRLTALARLSGEPTAASHDTVVRPDGWEDLLGQAADGISSFLVHPECPEAMVNQFNIAVCSFIEEAFIAGQGAAALEMLENLRRNELRPWLEMNPPLRLRTRTRRTGKLFDREAELIRDLRGAYFTLHYPMLPHHYRLFGKRSDSPGPVDLTPMRGRRELVEIRAELTELFAAMKNAVPHYVHEQLGRRSAHDELVESLRCHQVNRLHRTRKGRIGLRSSL